MNIENLQTLKIHTLSQEQFDREYAAGRTEKNAIYLTPDEKVDLSNYVKTEQLSEHNTSTMAHSDIRGLINKLTEELNSLLDVDDTTIEQLSEMVGIINENKDVLESLTTNKVNVTDIINDLVTNEPTKPLSAAQGVVLKALIDAIVVPTNVSQLTNDSKYITGYTETDPTVPAWAKESTKPTYTKSEIGLSNVDNVQQYSVSNPPPYPVTSVNGQTGRVVLNELPPVTTSDNGKVLMVVDGAWQVVTLNLSVDSNGTMSI